MTRDDIEDEEEDGEISNGTYAPAGAHNGAYSAASSGRDASAAPTRHQQNGSARTGTPLPKRFESLPSALTAAAVARDAHLPPPPPPGHAITSSPLRSPIEDAARFSQEAAALRASIDGKEAKCKKYKAKIKAMGTGSNGTPR